MVDTIMRFLLILLCSATTFAIYDLSKNGHDCNAGLTLIAALAGILAALFPVLEELTAKFGKNLELSVKRRRETPDSERQAGFEFAQNAFEITDEKKKLIENAKGRSDEERSPEDYLVLATDAWRDKKYDDGLKYAFNGLNLNPKDIRTKATLIERGGS